MQIESTSCCPSEIYSSPSHTAAEANLLTKTQIEPTPKLKQYLSPSRASKRTTQSTVKRIRTSVLRSEYSDTVKKRAEQGNGEATSRRHGQKPRKESRLVNAECQTTQLQNRKARLQLKPSAVGQGKSQVTPIVKLLSFRDLPPASLNISREFQVSQVRKQRQLSEANRTQKRAKLVDCTAQLQYILQYRRPQRKADPPKNDLTLQPKLSAPSSKEDFLEKMRQYKFATHYFSEDEFFNMIQEFRKAALPETKWPVLIIDRVYEKLAH